MLLKIIKIVFIFVALISTFTTVQIAANYIALIETKFGVRVDIVAVYANIGLNSATIKVVLNITNPSALEVMVKDTELTLYLQSEKIAFARNYTHIKIFPHETITKHLLAEHISARALNALRQANATGHMIWLIYGKVWLKIEKFNEYWIMDVSTIYEG